MQLHSEHAAKIEAAGREANAAARRAVDEAVELAVGDRQVES